MSDFTIIKLPEFSDARGQLVVMEKVLPFSPQRVFWISGADGQTRGGHRHRVTRQALIAVAGSVAVLMHDGKRLETVTLDRPNQCLLVEPDDWHTMTFSAGAILLVLASAPYDARDYIHENYPR